MCLPGSSWTQWRPLLTRCGSRAFSAHRSGWLVTAFLRCVVLHRWQVEVRRARERWTRAFALHKARGKGPFRCTFKQLIDRRESPTPARTASWPLWRVVVVLWRFMRRGPTPCQDGLQPELERGVADGWFTLRAAETCVVGRGDVGRQEFWVAAERGEQLRDPPAQRLLEFMIETRIISQLHADRTIVMILGINSE